MSDRVYRGLISVCGVVLVGFGLWFLWTGWAAVARRDWWQQY
jgi:hypothetical protein